MSQHTEKDNVSIGVIGCGTIASAIVMGLAKAQQQSNAKAAFTISRISLSARSTQKSAALQAMFPDLVTIHADNQEILDRSDIVFLCVLNDQTETVLGPLTFDVNRHTLVSLVVRFSFVGGVFIIIFCASPGRFIPFTLANSFY